jgi:hypothetical protein
MEVKPSADCCHKAAQISWFTGEKINREIKKRAAQHVF